MDQPLLPPKISILMPVKNAERWLHACCESIQAQDFKDWELIAVDDSSTDQTLKILNAFALKDHRFKVLKNIGEGIIPAIRLAFDNSYGTFITRMDADDVMPASKLKALLEIVINNPKCIATGKVQYFSDEQPVSDGYLEYQDWLNERCEKSDHWLWVYRECVIASANWMAHRSLIKLDNWHYPEDYDLVFQWYAKAIPVISTGETTHLWREHPDRTSRSSKHYQQSAFFRLKLNYFVKLDHDPRKTLCVLGQNKKSKLTSSELNRIGLKVELINYNNVDTFSKVNPKQVLVAVYPELRKRLKIAELLHAEGLSFGADYWWL